jgi:hypothetical protein
MRKHVAVVLLVLSVFAGAGSNGVLNRASGQSRQLTLVQQERRLGPKPTPRWYWRWVDWRLGEGYAKNHRREQSIRPTLAPHGIPHWAWRRLHLFLRARLEGGGGSPTNPPEGRGGYAAAIAYSRGSLGFTPLRVVEVGSAGALRAAISHLRVGDLVKASGSFVVSGETVIAKRLSAPAVLDLSGVSFVNSGGLNQPAVWLNNASNLRIYGGDLSTADTGGACLLSYGGQDVTWWGFTAHDCGGTGAAIATVSAAAEHDDFQGTIWKVGQNLARDPHAEKGSGEHCVNLDDGGQYAFQDNRFAFYCHDIPTGAAIEYGSRNIPPVHNAIYLKAANLTFVSQTQTGGNAIQFWGVNGQSADIKYLAVAGAEGYGLFDGGMYSGTTLSGVTVEYGRASNTNQNPRYAGKNPWDSSHNVAYKSVRPFPRP